METSDQHRQYTRPQHLNPFYIESNDGLSLRGEYDDSDDDWRGDYGDFERKGLLHEDDAGESDNGFSHSRPSMDRNGFASSQRNRQVLGRNSSGGLLCRLFMAFGFVFVFFLVILTIIARNDPRDTDRQRIYRPSDSDETPPPSSTDHKGSIVVNDPRAEDARRKSSLPPSD
jgi:preprotein translocase subunit SecG